MQTRKEAIVAVVQGDVYIRLTLYKKGKMTSYMFEWPNLRIKREYLPLSKKAFTSKIKLDMIFDLIIEHRSKYGLS